MGTEFSWLWRPMPQIGRCSRLSTSYATTRPDWRASSAPITAGQALPVRLTQSTLSSFVKRISRSKPSAAVAR